MKESEQLTRLFLPGRERYYLTFTVGYFDDCTAIIGLKLALTYWDWFNTTVCASCHMPEKINV